MRSKFHPISPVFTLLAAYLFACSSETPLASHPSEVHPAWRRARILTQDASSGELAVLDVEDEEWISRFPAAPNLKLHVGASGTFAVLADRETDTVRFLHSGVSVVDHSEGFDVPHIHVYKADPQLLPFKLEGIKPGHITSRPGSISAFFDGDAKLEQPGRAVTLKEDELLQSTNPKLHVLTTNTAHRGFQFETAQGTILSQGGEHPQGYPVGLQYFDSTTDLRQTFQDCIGLATGTRVGSLLAFQCDSGYWLFQTEPTPEPIRVIQYQTAARPQGLFSHVDQRLVLTGQGTAELTMLDTDTGTITSSGVGGEICDLQFEWAKGQNAILLRSDGHLLRVDLKQKKLDTDLAIVDPFDCASLERPHLAVSPQRAYISDPQRNQVHELEVIPVVSVRRQYKFNGRPSQLVVLGIDDKTRNLAAGAPH